MTTFSNVYGITSSSSYSLTINLAIAARDNCSLHVSSSHTSHYSHHTLSRGSTSITVPLALAATNNNTITLNTTAPITSILIANPPGTFYPAPSFSVSGSAVHVNCTPSLCAPVGSKIGYLSPNGSASLSISPPPGTTVCGGQKYVELTYINNDVALDTSWTTGNNARNITVSVNNASTVRLEVPLSGHSS